MSAKLKAIAAAAALIAIPTEGLRQYAYYDPPGILTVCYGSTTNVVKGRKYSIEECKARLDRDMMQAVAVVDRCHPNLPANVHIAFSDAVFNIGPKIACGPNSTAAKLLQAKQYEMACQELARWNKAKVAGAFIELPGLTKRRDKEMKVCLGNDLV